MNACTSFAAYALLLFWSFSDIWIFLVLILGEGTCAFSRLIIPLHALGSCWNNEYCICPFISRAILANVFANLLASLYICLKMMVFLAAISCICLTSSLTFDGTLHSFRIIFYNTNESVSRIISSYREIKQYFSPCKIALASASIFDITPSTLASAYRMFPWWSLIPKANELNLGFPLYVPSVLHFIHPYSGKSHLTGRQYNLGL